MDTSTYARADCRVCHGAGTFVARDEHGYEQYSICPCTVFTQRSHAAEERIRRLFPGAAAKMTFANYQTGDNLKNEQALRVSRAFVEQWPLACEQGWILGFRGDPRAGKTHLAHAIAIDLVRRYLVRPQMLSVPRMLRLERERFNEEHHATQSPIQTAMSADLLILDDLGAEYRKISSDPNAVSWVDEQLYLILDERVLRNRPTIYTTNLEESDLETAFDAAGRVYGRLKSNEVALLEVRPVRGLRDERREQAHKLLGLA